MITVSQLTNVPRFQQPEDLGDCHNCAAQDAAQRLWDVWADADKSMGYLDTFAGRHNTVADCGEARADASSDIDAITDRLRAIAAELTLLVRDAKGVAA